MLTNSTIKRQINWTESTTQTIIHEINLPAGIDDLGQCVVITDCFFNVFTIGGLFSFEANAGVILGNLISKCDPLSVIILNKQ